MCRLLRPGGTVLVEGLSENEYQSISQHIIARKGANVIGSFIGNNVLQAVANGPNSGMLDFEYMITHKPSFDQFDEGLEAMRNGTALEVILYPWGLPWGIVTDSRKGEDMELVIGVVDSARSAEIMSNVFMNGSPAVKRLLFPKKMRKSDAGLPSSTAQNFMRTAKNRSTAPEVQAVVVTTWDPAHAQYVLASIKAGKYVFCEKPLATEAAECEKILAAEQVFGRKIVQVGLMRRYDPGYTELKKTIEEGKIGQPLIVHACHRNMTHAATMTSEMSIKNSGVHEIDVLRWLLDDEYVSGQVVLPRQSRISGQRGAAGSADHDAENKKGICIDVEISQSSGYGYDIQCEVVGDLGTARPPDPPGVITKTDCSRAAGIMPGWETRFVGAYNIEMQDC